MARIVCYRCFAEFEPDRLLYRCPTHPDRLFPAPGLGRDRQPPRFVACKVCSRLTGYRVCPTCRRDLPYYVGRVRQQVVAVTGWTLAGKTVYLWSLLHQLREKL